MKKLIFLTVLLFGLITQKSNAQCTLATNATSTSNYLGFSGGANPLNFTSAGTPYQMILTNGGDLNVTGAANGYQIDANYVLWNNGDNTSLYTGISAGNASITGTENTLTGYSTGNSLTAGSYNTFTGDYAGNALLDGKDDSYYGVNAEITD